MRLDIRDLQQRYLPLLKKEIAVLRHRRRSTIKCECGKLHDSSAIIRMRPNFSVTELQGAFNRYFKDDLYGSLRDEANIILSSGSLNADEFPLCQSLRYAIDCSLARNWYGYSDSRGRLSVRKAIAELTSHRFGLDGLTADNVSLTCGVTNAINTILQTLKTRLPPKFRILTHLPTYSPFVSACQAIAPVDFAVMGEGRWDLDLFVDSIRKDTKILLILGDLNPLGRLMPIPILKRLMDICDKVGIWLIFDEAGAVFPSYDFRGLKPTGKFILLNSDSKSLGISGMKTGSLVAGRQIIEDFYAEASSSYGSPGSFFYLMQEFHALFKSFMIENVKLIGDVQLSLFDKDDQLEIPFLQLLYDDYRLTHEHYERLLVQKRQYVVSRLSALPRSLIKNVVRPDTGVNLSLQIAQSDNSYRFFKELLRHKKVSVFPGACSGIDSGCWVRISYAIPEKSLKNGVDRLVSWLRGSDVRKMCLNNKIYRKVLIEVGLYDEFPELNFYGHLSDVYNAMTIICRMSRRIISRNGMALMRQLAFLHDAGKVISVQLAAIQRIVRLQRSGKNEWTQYTDVELFGLKNRLVSGAVFSLEDLLSVYPVLKKYERLIDFTSNYSPNDEVVRASVFEESGLSLPVMHLLGEATPLLAKDSDEHHFLLSLLDIADKCSDYIQDCSSKVDLLSALDKKKAYVMRRYRPESMSEKKQIIADFKKSRMNLDTIITAK